MASTLLSLLTPPRCTGCGAWGPTWCPRCANVEPRPVWIDIGLPVLAHHRFEGAIRRTIIDWKDESDRDAERRVTAWMAHGLLPLLDALPCAMVVPVPASRDAERRRGRRVLARVLRTAVPSASVSTALVSVRRRADQAGLGRTARERNLHRSMRWDGPRDRPLIIVDDIITSGATLREAVRAVHAAGGVVALGFALAHRERAAPVVPSHSGLGWE